ncbi:MAG: hypothetical protein GF410_15335 [Chitinivibrionales bacterium]|nr:hypothetical protein [Chitinivibrionales bacterium]
MPGGDGTGPGGMGPMTGRAAGYCAGYSAPGYANPVGGRGFFGRGWGRGRGGWGRRNWFYGTGLTGWQRAGYGYAPPVPPPSMTKDQEVEGLKNHAQMLQDELSAVNKRLKDLESRKDK